MEQIFSKLEFTTNGEGFIDITNDLNLFIEKNNFDSGILNLTSLHTSCSLTINENADPNVLRDLKKYIQSIVPYNSYLTLSKNREEISYKHYQEGADDMPAHIKTSLTNTCLSLIKSLLSEFFSVCDSSFLAAWIKLRNSSDEFLLCNAFAM